MSVLQDRAKQVYLDAVSVSSSFNLREFTERSVELLGQSVAHATVRRWSMEGAWLRAASEIRRDAERDRLAFMLDLCFGRATNAETPTDIVNCVRSYTNTLDSLPASYAIDEAGRITDLKNLVFDTLQESSREGAADLASTSLSHLTSLYKALTKKTGDLTSIREPGIDIDGWLLGVASREDETTIPNRRLTQDEFDELVRCKEDLVYMATNHGWLKHTSRGAIKWDEPYPYQIELWRTLQANHNVITIKSRQIGCSWATAAYIVWLMIFHPDIEIIILSKSELYAVKFLEKVKFFFNRLPKFMKPAVTGSSQTQFTVTFRAGTGEIGSCAVYSLTTTTDTGRSFSARFVAMDEAAFLPSADETWAAVKPTTSLGGQVAVISTPNGVGNFYHRLWLRCEAGESRFVPIRAYWRECGFDEEWFADVSDGLTVQQVLQEYELQFLSSGNPFFDLSQVALCYYPSDEHPEILVDGKNVKLSTMTNYTGIDSSRAERTVHGEPDYHSIVTLNEWGVQIDAFHSNKMGIDEFAGYTLALDSGNRIEIEGKTTAWHRKYPGIVVIERGSTGDVVYSRHICPNDNVSNVIGRYTTGGVKGLGSKMRILNLLKLAFAGRLIAVTDKFTYQCLQAFESKGMNKAEAADGMFDDPVIALALSYSELHKAGGYVVEMPALSDGTRMVSVMAGGDRPLRDIADVLPVGEIMQGPIISSPGSERLTDEFANMQSPRVRQLFENR